LAWFTFGGGQTNLGPRRRELGKGCLLLLYLLVQMVW